MFIQDDGFCLSLKITLFYIYNTNNNFGQCVNVFVFITLTDYATARSGGIKNMGAIHQKKLNVVRHISYFYRYILFFFINAA